MKPMPPADRILALGVALEKGAHETLVINIPSPPGYALFRQYGLQVIPDESHELDTGGNDTVILTPRAGLVSGVLLQITSALPCPASSAEFISLVKEARAVLRSERSSSSPDWETKALGKIVTAALSLVERLKPGSGKNTHTAPRKPTTKRPGAPGIPPHVRHEIGDEVADHLEAMSDFPVSFDWASTGRFHAQDRSRATRTTPFLIVCGLPGKVHGGLWLPLPSASLKLSGRLISRISAELAERGLDPSYAQLILGEMLARSLRTKRR